MQSFFTFEVADFQPLLSDHCQIIATLQTFILEKCDIEIYELPVIKWSKVKEERFKNNLSRSEFNEIDLLIRDIPEMDMCNYQEDEIGIQN